MDARFLSSLSEIPAADWDARLDSDYPFLRHAFLHALEAGGAVGPGTGWTPRHLVLEDNGQARAVLPLYEKAHSYGEYVFDWSWAGAYERHGLAYYPKWLTAIPFSPVPGPRVGLAPDTDPATLMDTLLEAARDAGVSSWHALFVDAASRQSLDHPELLQRTGVQFVWQNRGYADFDDFLGAMTARRRKTVRKERRRLREAGVRTVTLEGRELTPEHWEAFYRFYRITYLQRSGHGGYLPPAVFHRLGETLPDNLVLMLAERDGETVAGALYLRDATALYGRYWGSTATIDGLHFELCYYQGIEYCLRHGLQRFDPGTQGEHKVLRGFEPELTASLHWVAHPDFREAIARFVDEEAAHMRGYRDAAREALPFRRGLD